MIKAVIIDDEQNARYVLEEMLKLYTPHITWIKSFPDLISAQSTLLQEDIAVVFLDIEIGKENGFDIFKQIPHPAFKIIFVTAYEDYALEAFRHAAFDYLLKPIDGEQLTHAVSRLSDALDKEKTAVKLDALLHKLNLGQQTKKKLVLKTADSIHLVSPDEIVFCEADSSYTMFRLNDGSRILVTKTLGSFEELLGQEHFLRIHQSYLVNLNYLKRFEKADGGKIILKDGSSLPVASRKRDHLLEWLSK